MQFFAQDVMAQIKLKEIQHKHVFASLQHGIMEELAQVKGIYYLKILI